MVTSMPADPRTAADPAPGTAGPAADAAGTTDAALREAAALLRGAGAVLLDFNGTLSLDEDLLEHCYERGLAALSLSPMGDGEYAALLGRSEHDIAGALLAARSTDTAAGAVTTSALLSEVAHAYVEECARRPRIPASHLRLVQRLHELGIPLAIATGTLREMIGPVLVQAGLGELIPVVVTIEDVTRGKPDPEGFLAAAGRLGVKVSSAVVVEDSGSGVAAAHAAGAAAIGVGPSAHGADVRIAHLGQLEGLL